MFDGVSCRHGGIRAYIRRKLTDLKRFSVQLKIMPPDDARWSEFFVSVALMALLALFFAGAFATSTDINVQTVYLDRATMVTVDLDHCSLRYIPTRNQPSPDRELTSPKVRASLVVDPLVCSSGMLRVHTADRLTSACMHAHTTRTRHKHKLRNLMTTLQ
jgi:hypothetical protein